MAIHTHNFDTESTPAVAAMAHVLKHLPYETHPILGRPTCAFPDNGDFVMLVEEEIEKAAQIALEDVIRNDLPRFTHLPDVRLYDACRRRLNSTASALTLESFPL